MSYTDVIYERIGPVAHVTLNRPEKLNALSVALLEELEDACAQAKADDQVRVVVIKGAGRAFSAGYDLSEVTHWYEQMNVDEMRDRRASYPERYFRILWDMPKAVIAQVHGYCLAGGGDLACMCDITIASEDAVFGEPPARYVGMPSTFVWPYVLGRKKTLELCFTGKNMDAHEALQWGMVNKVVPRDRLEAEVDTIAYTIARVPPLTIKYSKMATNRCFELMGFRTASTYAAELGAIMHMTPTPEHNQFFQMVREKGLKAALEWRDSRSRATQEGPGR